MSVARRQAQVDAPVSAIWELVGNPNRYPVEFGMEPARLAHKVFDVLAGKRFYRSWLEQSVAALQAAARQGAGSEAAPAPHEKDPPD
jgi:hypothetical protein